MGNEDYGIEPAMIQRVAGEVHSIAWVCRSAW
jgi:hypothetical protein